MNFFIRIYAKGKQSYNTTEKNILLLELYFLFFFKALFDFNQQYCVKTFVQLILKLKFEILL